MLALAMALGVRVEWLEYGRGDKRDGGTASPPPSAITAAQPLGTSNDPVDEDIYAYIPQYTAKAAAGSGHDNPHVELRGTLAFKREWLRYMGVNPKNLKVIYAEGSSMEPTINNHDVLLVDESRVDPVDGHIFAIYSENKGTIVKRLVMSDLDGWIIRSDNADKTRYADQVLPDGEVYEHRILGRVIWRGGEL